MKNPILSILVPTVPERSSEATRLISLLQGQSQGFPVEVLSFCDNRQRSIGLKRQALLDLARGKYVAFCDDDDTVASDYIATLCDMASANVDVLCFNQSARWNDLESTVEFRIDHPINGLFVPGGITKRFPWHVCAWRRDLARHCVFTDKNWGEDADWVAQAFELTETQAYTPKVLHYYNHQDSSSLAIDTH